MEECITCDNLCDAQLQTATVVTLSRDISATDTEIFLVPNSVVPVMGYGIFNGCVTTTTETVVHEPVPCGCRAHTHTHVDTTVTDKYEIIKYCDTRIEDSGEVVLINLVRGLPFTGCNDTISVAEFIKEHAAGEVIKVGTPEIHYYWCKMCSCLADLRTRVEALEAMMTPT